MYWAKRLIWFLPLTTWSHRDTVNQWLCPNWRLSWRWIRPTRRFSGSSKLLGRLRRGRRLNCSRRSCRRWHSRLSRAALARTRRGVFRAQTFKRRSLHRRRTMLKWYNSSRRPPLVYSAVMKFRCRNWGAPARPRTDPRRRWCWARQALRSCRQRSRSSDWL